MRSLLYYILLVGLLGGGFYWWYQNQGTQDQSKAAALFGTLPGAFNAMGGGDDTQMTYSYSVTMDYPAQGALDFYQQKMTAKGWAPMDSNMFGTPNQWGSSPNVDPETRKPACEYKYVTLWNGPKKDRIDVLVLSYFDPSANGACAATPSVNKLVVTLQEMPTPK